MKMKNEIENRIKQVENAIDECKATMHEAFSSTALKLMQVNETIEDKLSEFNPSSRRLPSSEVKAFDNLLQATLTSKKTCGEITGMLELLRKMKSAYTSSKSK